MVKKVLFLDFLLIMCVVFSKNGVAHQGEASEALKTQVEVLVASNNLMEANKLINRNSSLDPAFSLGILTQNLTAAANSSNPELLAYTQLSLGNFWWFRSNRVKAYEHFYQSEKISREHGINWIAGLSIMNRSHLETVPEVKIDMLRESIRLFELVNDTVNLAKAHLNLGQVYSDFVLKQQNDSTYGYHDKSMLLNKLGYYRDSAFFHYERAEELNDSLSHPEIIASVHVHYAEWYHFENDLTKSEKYYSNAADFFMRAGQLKGYIFCKTKLVDLNLRNGNFNQAANMLPECVALSEQYQYQDYLATTYALYVTLYDSLKDPSKALHYQKLYTNSLNQLNQSISMDKIHALNLEYALNDQENEIAFLNEKKSQQQLLMILLAVLTILTGMVAYLMFQNKRRKFELARKSLEESKKVSELKVHLLEADKAKIQLQQELLEVKVRLKSEHIILIANQMNKLDAFLQSLNEDIKSAMKGLNDGFLKEKINALKLSLAQSLMEQSNLKEITALSSEVNQEFFLHIQHKFPQLTKDDVKLLSFLIMEMGSKEIAHYFSISVESVNKKRYRLRQKLKLDYGISFVEFYRQTLQELAVGNR